jgi:mycothiol synthase
MSQEDMTWRPLNEADRAAITALAAACQAVDGGQALIAVDRYVIQRDTAAPPHATIGAFDSAGRLAAATVVQLDDTAQEQRANIVGQVHPEYRGRRLGNFLIEWSVAQGRALLAAHPADRPHVLRLTTESLSEAAARLYARHGLTQQFAEDVMRRDLRAALPDAPLPPGVTLATWAPELADQFFEAYQAAFRERPGFPVWNAEQWVEWATGDEGFHPAMSLLARDGEQPIGFIVCDNAWIVQVGTRPEWRGRGLGSALVVEALRRFRAAGRDHVTLDVNVNNPSAARVYARLGFVVVGQRARYVRAI